MPSLPSLTHHPPPTLPKRDSAQRESGPSAEWRIKASHISALPLSNIWAVRRRNQEPSPTITWVGGKKEKVHHWLSMHVGVSFPKGWGKAFGSFLATTVCKVLTVVNYKPPSQCFTALKFYDHTQQVGLVCCAGERCATRHNMLTDAPSTKGETAQRTAASSPPPPGP